MSIPITETEDMAAPLVPKRSFLLALLLSLRPRQWTKNLVVFAGILFSLDNNRVFKDFISVCLTFVIFCMIASATYLINDVLDIKSDQNHPTKRFRPIPAGQISVASAVSIATILFVTGCVVGYYLNPLVGLAAIAYSLLTLSYSIWLKHVVILDLLTLAGGFVLRAVAGAWAIAVPISSWLLLCTLLFALYLGIGKRRAELLAVLAGRKHGRGVISEYTAGMLDQMGNVVASALVMSYALYSIQSATASNHHYLVLTFPFVLYGILRYSYLAHKHQGGEAPDEMLIKDRSLLITLVAWGVTTGIIMTHHF